MTRFSAFYPIRDKTSIASWGAVSQDARVSLARSADTSLPSALGWKVGEALLCCSNQALIFSKRS